MKNTENIVLDFKLPLIWQFSKSKSKLKTPDSTIIVLKSAGKNKASFVFNDREFTIRSKSFWNNVVTLSEGSNQLAVIKRSFGGKTIITFENGNEYLVKVKNNVLVRLSVYNAGQNELVGYRTHSKLRASLKINDTSLVEDPIEMLFLIVLSGLVYRTILKELKLIDLKELNFSEKPAKKD